MTSQIELEKSPLSSGADYEQLAATFRPIFRRIAEGALERERARALPYEQIVWLKEAGLGAVRVPVEYGGAGASLPQLMQLLIELADSSLPQALRCHFAFVEDRMNAAPDDRGRFSAIRKSAPTNRTHSASKVAIASVAGAIFALSAVSPHASHAAIICSPLL